MNPSTRSTGSYFLLVFYQIQIAIDTKKGSTPSLFWTKSRVKLQQDPTYFMYFGALQSVLVTSSFCSSTMHFLQNEDLI